MQAKADDVDADYGVHSLVVVNDFKSAERVITYKILNG